MHRMTQRKPSSLVVTAMAFALCTTIGALPANAGPPSVLHANADYAASGYVTPAGMVPPEMYQGGVMPVGFYGGCDSPGCDSMGSCGSPTCGSGGGVFDYGCDDCGGNCGGSCTGSGIFGGGGLFGEMCSNGGCLKKACMFCRGEGCSACACLSPASILAGLHALRPYSAAGIHAQRWYDFSAEAVFLAHTNGGLSGPVTSLLQGPIPPATTPPPDIVLGLGAADSGNDLEFGARLSAAVICGAGGNLEFTYMGGHEWNSEAFVADPGPVYFSFLSNFGTDPIGGFDDTDRSIRQSIAARSNLHTFEINYRRRTVGPYGRFQGSWLFGLRYLRFSNSLNYSTLGENDNTVNTNLPRFFQSDDTIRNHLFGPQCGFDLWWNIHPGVNFGMGVKGAWVQNDFNRRTFLNFNSINSGTPATPAPTADVVSDGERDTTVMGEFEAKIIYRLSHSWSFRSAYYAIAADDIVFADVPVDTILDVADPTFNGQSGFHFNSLVVQGFSFGAEYIW